MAMATLESTLTLDDLRKSTKATISLTEAGAALGVAPRTVSTGIAEGNIPAIKLGRRVVIPREKFLALFD
ncbi:helix-turn-helix domain-containing protein [Nocardioides speluncae]|uniref:helix-turn-helix domain-containing protein n=1 Tax=Nocardioides speluncae TaxID=2670337 RepID=UPI00197DF584|nr:helix-turn-helix domain-containing protein [Nocardioides speluncae]